MTLNQLIHFVTIAETGHMGKAAQRLFLAQPSLSASLAKLEEELRIRLFERKGHHLTITAEGEAFLEHAQKILQEVDEAQQHMNRLAGRKESVIRLGCITPVLREYFPAKMQAFLHSPGNEQVRFEFAIENTDELIRRLKNGLYDMLLCVESEDEQLCQIPVIREPLLFVMQEGGKMPECWEEIAEMNLIGYEEGSIMRKKLLKLAEERHVRFNFVYRAPTEEAIASLVEYGLGAAIIPWSDAVLGKYRVSCGPLPGEPVFRRISLATLKDEESSGAAARFIDFLQNGSRIDIDAT